MKASLNCSARNLVRARIDFPVQNAVNEIGAIVEQISGHTRPQFQVLVSKSVVLSITSLPMPSFGPLQVYIMSVETETILEEYKLVTSGRKTECWIESREGLHFSVNMFVTRHMSARLKVDSEAFLFKVYVDGQIISNCFLGCLSSHGFQSSRILDGVQVTEKVLKPFRFAKTQFIGTTQRQRETSNLLRIENCQTDKSILNGLGTIQIVVQTVRIKPASHQTFRGFPAPIPKIVNEKTKKTLVTHSVEYITLECCFEIRLGAESPWRILGLVPIVTTRNLIQTIHRFTLLSSNIVVEVPSVLRLY